MNTKVCFKGDGTEETGAKIIKALEKLGGGNIQGYGGNGNDYYFIGNSGEIIVLSYIPPDRTLSNPDTYIEKPFPKWMWVSDLSEEDAKTGYPRYVIGKFKHPILRVERYISICAKENNYFNSCSWKYAVDIEEPTEQELIKQEIGELKAKLEELGRRVK